MVLILAFHGLGAGLMLAALHRSAMGNTEPARMGSVAGMYSMVRFAGMAIGTAMAGVILQHFLDSGLPTLEAYQWSFLVFGVAGLFGYCDRGHHARTETWQKQREEIDMGVSCRNERLVTVGGPNVPVSGPGRSAV